MKTVLVQPLKTFIDAEAIAGQIESDAVRSYLTSHEVEQPEPGARLALAWPVAPPAIVTQAYGIHKQWYAPFGLPGHEGIDIRALTNTPVMACADGEVVRVELSATNNAYGVHVRLKHVLADDEYESIYAHFRLASPTVQVGEVVGVGHVLGKADNTGNSSGSHLHITLKHKGKGSPWMGRDIVNPTPYFRELFPGKFLVDVGGNLRKEPDLNAPILRYIAPGALVHAIDFGGPGGDWWKLVVDPPAVPASVQGWYWQVGYKLRAYA